jgi:hypothetical protein
MEHLGDFHPSTETFEPRCLDIGYDQVEEACTEPAASVFRITAIAQAEPRGVSCTTRKSSPAL